jgi:tetratricopeptide (TPR) repeat protein
VRANFNLAASAQGSNEEGQLSEEGGQAILRSADAWERYLKLDPKKPDGTTAGFAALAYGALQDYEKAVAAQRLAVRDNPTANSWFQLAEFAFRAGNEKLGERAGEKAARLTPTDQRNNVRDLVDRSRTQGREIAKAIAEQEKAAKKEGGEPGTAFGPLPGQGTGAGQ